MARNALTRPTQGKITKSTVRVLLADSFGTGNVRITREGEIHVNGVMPNTDRWGWYLWGQIGNPDTEARLRQLPVAALSGPDADQLDGSIYDIADRLENLVELADDLVNYYQVIPELREVLRHAKTASKAIDKAKTSSRILWSAARDGRRHD